ncbi:MAG: hypothetical protein NTW86_21780 [Candidatus Sumerlaeota bacterium]|nr:hypothetical protein [Candidatus Sumerlaeota bacterium]
MQGNGNLILAELLALAVCALLAAIWAIRLTRRASRTVEDRFVELYSELLQGICASLNRQDKAFAALRETAARAGAVADSLLAESLHQIEQRLAQCRTQYNEALRFSDASHISWDAFAQAKSGPEENWSLLAETTMALNVQVEQRLRHLEVEDAERRQRLVDAQARAQELENRIQSIEQEYADISEEAGGQALREMEGDWGARMEEAKRVDESLQRGVKAMNVELGNLELVNQRLISLSEKLRIRQETMARRIAELEAQANLTPMLKAELRKMSVENEELHGEIQRLLDAKADIEKQMETLRVKVQDLQSQPTRSEATEKQIAHDRQVLQLLREQNQRLIFELEEAREETEEARNRAPGAGKVELLERFRRIEAERDLLATKVEQSQKAFREKAKELDAATEELRRLRAAASAMADKN